MPFNSLGLSPALLHAIAEQAYSEPTEVQSRAIPVILQGNDLVARAQTGSGKTAAFVLPMLQGLGASSATPRRVKALILVPTRELAIQVGEFVRDIARHLPESLRVFRHATAPTPFALRYRSACAEGGEDFDTSVRTEIGCAPEKLSPSESVKTAVVFGGVSINPQMMALRGGADIVVATPGRLLDLVKHNALSLSAVATLVLDEADRLLDLGFEDELRRILALLPPKRQNLFFSATFPHAVQTLADALLHDPVRIEVEAVPATEPSIAQRAIEVDASRRTQLLRHLVEQGGDARVLVFVATKYAAEVVAYKLGRAGIHAEAFHGEQSQGKRSQVLADFKARRVQVLIATDVAARGIDIDHLEMVVNYDLPRSPVDHVHRIGRTGRAGKSGVAISFVSAQTEAHFRLIEKRQRLRVPRERVEGFEPVEHEPATPSLTDPSGTGGIKGKRKSKKDKLREAAAGNS